jgi:hypothetical protein
MAKDATLAGRGNWSPAAMGKETLKIGLTVFLVFWEV